MMVSIIIRTYNEERYIKNVLENIYIQEFEKSDIEIIIVDSGSTDNTVMIAEKYDCRVLSIKKEEFSFGRSLNIGCSSAKGNFLIFISGHCIPATKIWLKNLIKPLKDGLAVYSYGKQLGKESTRFSEQCLFDKYFPGYSKIPQEGFFCNNANAAIVKKVWEEYRFEDEITGLEDMYLAKQLVAHGKKIAYIAEAPVYHIHNESWQQVKTRYEREAFALQQIMPDVQFNLIDLFRYLSISILQDTLSAIRKKELVKNIGGIFLFRFMQYWGGYSGHHEHRKISQAMKYRYFYPKDTEKRYYEEKNSCSVTNESK